MATINVQAGNVSSIPHAKAMRVRETSRRSGAGSVQIAQLRLRHASARHATGRDQVWWSGQKQQRVFTRTRTRTTGTSTSTGVGGPKIARLGKSSSAPTNNAYRSLVHLLVLLSRTARVSFGPLG